MLTRDHKWSRGAAWTTLALAVAYGLGLSYAAFDLGESNDLVQALGGGFVLAVLPLAATLPIAWLIGGSLRSHSAGPLVAAWLIIMPLLVLAFLSLPSVGMFVFPIAGLLAIAAGFAAVSVPPTGG